MARMYVRQDPRLNVGAEVEEFMVTVKRGKNVRLSSGFSKDGGRSNTKYREVQTEDQLKDDEVIDAAARRFAVD
jgi:hypothetical protein